MDKNRKPQKEKTMTLLADWAVSLIAILLDCGPNIVTLGIASALLISIWEHSLKLPSLLPPVPGHSCAWVNPSTEPSCQLLQQERRESPCLPDPVSQSL